MTTFTSDWERTNCYFLSLLGRCLCDKRLPAVLARVLAFSAGCMTLGSVANEQFFDFRSFLSDVVDTIPLKEI